jgi:hypothetical protein
MYIIITLLGDNITLPPSLGFDNIAVNHELRIVVFVVVYRSLHLTSDDAKLFS